MWEVKAHREDRQRSFKLVWRAKILISPLPRIFIRAKQDRNLFQRSETGSSGWGFAASPTCSKLHHKWPNVFKSFRRKKVCLETFQIGSELYVKACNSSQIASRGFFARVSGWFQKYDPQSLLQHPWLSKLGWVNQSELGGQGNVSLILFEIHFRACISTFTGTERVPVPCEVRYVR